MVLMDTFKQKETEFGKISLFLCRFGSIYSSLSSDVYALSNSA